MTDEQIKYYFKQVGHKGRSITEVWYRNPNEIKSKLDKYIPALGQKIEKIIRWRTDIGIKALGDIRAFIKEKLDGTSEINTKNFKEGNYLFRVPIIDFNELIINGKTINEFLYSNIKHSYSYGNWNDLSGIPLDNIRISNAIIKNAQLSHASFDCSVLQSIEFFNCNFNDCSFQNCHLTGLRIPDGSGAFSNCNWIGSTVNAIEISSKNIGINPVYKKISYARLIMSAFNGGSSRQSKHTDFSACTILNDDIIYQFKEHVEYINWYQSTMIKYGQVKKEKRWIKRISKKTINATNALTTMNWYSPISTLLTGIIVILIFSLLYNFAFNYYFIGLDSYGKALNFSLQIFTSLGFGDMKPDLTKGILGSTLISIECALGYFWIALTIMVIGKRLIR